MKFFSTAILSLSGLMMVASSSTATDAAQEGGGNLRKQQPQQQQQKQDHRELTGYTHKVTIKATNLAPSMGTCQSPVWVGIHDGRFDMFNQGSRASEGIEAMAEDGDPAYLSKQFAVTRGTVWEGNIGSARFCSGEVVTLTDYLRIPNDGSPYFLSYATMVLPSNDAFLANAMPKAYRITNANRRPVQSVVTALDLGTEVWDAGTEVNDEVPRNAGGLAPNVPGAGVEEWYKIRPHPGFNAKGTGGILDREAYQNGDFKNRPGYKMMKLDIMIEQVSGSGGMAGSSSHNMIPADLP